MTELRFEVLRSDSMIVQEWRDFDRFEVNSIVNIPICLPNGCFTFRGIGKDPLRFSDFDNGSYLLKDSQGDTLIHVPEYGRVKADLLLVNTTDSCQIMVDAALLGHSATLIDLSLDCGNVIDPVCYNSVNYPNPCVAEKYFGVPLDSEDLILGTCAVDFNNGNGGAVLSSNPDCQNEWVSINFEYFTTSLPNGIIQYEVFPEVEGVPEGEYITQIGNFSHLDNHPDSSVQFFQPQLDVDLDRLDVLVFYGVCFNVATEPIVMQRNPDNSISGVVIEGFGFAPGIFQSSGPGDPLPNVEVQLLDPGLNVRQTTLTDENGYYEFTQLHFCDYYIKVIIPGVDHEPYHIKLSPFQQGKTDLDWVVTGSGITTSLTEMAFEDQIQVFPNPAFNRLNLLFQLQQTSDIQLQVFNTLGEGVLVREFPIPSGDFQTEIDLSRLQTGVYVLQFSDGTQTF
ncbi:MAG: T9SS type A sorting domain-containing protein, partial [Bacteroidota bacterium]